MAAADVQEMLDCFQIRKVLERYCRGVDRLDEEMINSVYWPEATDNHGVYIGPGKDFGAFLVQAFRGRYVATMHLLGQSNIRLQDNLAAADTYLIAYHRIENDAGVSIEKACARYVDELERRGNEWRIRDRTVVMEHLQAEQNIQTLSLNVNDFIRGKQNREDLSYKFLGR